MGLELILGLLPHGQDLHNPLDGNQGSGGGHGYPDIQSPPWVAELVLMFTSLVALLHLSVFSSPPPVTILLHLSLGPLVIGLCFRMMLSHCW